MIRVLKTWFERYFSDPQAVLVASLILGSLLVVTFFGGPLTPVIASVVIAYLLEGFVEALESRGFKRLPAVFAVFVIFIAVQLSFVFGLLPPLVNQIQLLIEEIPKMLSRLRETLQELPQKYPQFVTPDVIKKATDATSDRLVELGQVFVNNAIPSLVNLITLAIYLILMPLLVFFFLKDKTIILNWLKRFLPRDHKLVSQIWAKLDAQIGNYARGKVWEILIVGGAAFAIFAGFGLNYAVLLAVVVGLSVLIPYVGATVVTFPVAMIAYSQLGWQLTFWVVVAYLVLQALDGNVLVPLLFSEVVKIHPVAIIIAVLVFGGLWGVWGVFFAIPLATLVQALIDAWPRTENAAADDAPKSQ